MRKCGNCKSGKMSKGVTVLVIYNDVLPRGSFPLIPAEEYFVCLECHADIRFINKAVEAHATVRVTGKWNSAVLVFDDGEILRVKNPAVTLMQA